MKLITQKDRKQLLKNWTDDQGIRPPVVKIFSPVGAATWLIHSMNPQDPDILFGLCDPGSGFPELGYVPLSELDEIRVKVRIGPMTGGIPLERDKYFRPTHNLLQYAEAAQQNNRITENEALLNAVSQPGP